MAAPGGGPGLSLTWGEAWWYFQSEARGYGPGDQELVTQDGAFWRHERTGEMVPIRRGPENTRRCPLRAKALR